MMTHQNKIKTQLGLCDGRKVFYGLDTHPVGLELTSKNDDLPSIIQQKTTNITMGNTLTTVITVMSDKTGKQTVWAHGQCFKNCHHNKNGAYKNLGLKVVIGTLSLNGWDEYGGRDWTDKDWTSKGYKSHGVWDAHAWLEDAKGNVYDYIFEDYLEVIEIRTDDGDEVLENEEEVKSKMRCGAKVGLIEGHSKARIAEEQSIIYTPAPPKIQALIWFDISKAYDLH